MIDCDRGRSVGVREMKRVRDVKEFDECIFFFKQKTAYEVLRSLVGSEMCIRDRRSKVLNYKIGWL